MQQKGESGERCGLESTAHRIHINEFSCCYSGFLADQPPDSRKLGFLSGDADRRGEFTSHIRTQQYRQTLKTENGFQTAIAGDVEKKIEDIESQLREIEAQQGKRPKEAVMLVSRTLSKSAKADERRFQAVYRALRKFDKEETTYVPVKEVRRQLARQNLGGFASIDAILKAVDRDFDSNVHYVSVLSELSAREFPELGRMQLASLRDTSLSESVPHRLFDIGRTHETAFNFRDSRDTFYNFDTSRDKRTTQKTASQKIGSRLVKGKGIEICECARGSRDLKLSAFSVPFYPSLPPSFRSFSGLTNTRFSHSTSRTALRGDIGAKGSGSTSDFDNPGHLKVGI